MTRLTLHFGAAVVAVLFVYFGFPVTGNVIAGVNLAALFVFPHRA